jgi:2-methylcitrate dehydratase PrpD
MEEEDFYLDEMARVDVGLWYLGPPSLPYLDPKTPLEAKFSMQHSVAAALLDRRVGLAQYTPERLADERLRGLMRKIHMYVHPEMADRSSWKTETRFHEVTVTMQDGAKYSRRVYHPKGHKNNPLTPAELEVKFNECCGQRFSSERVDALRRTATNLAELPDIHELTALLRVSA